MAAVLSAFRMLAAGSRSNAPRLVLRNGCNDLGMQKLWRSTMRNGARGRSQGGVSSKNARQHQAENKCIQGKKTPFSLLQFVRSRFIHTTRARRAQVPNPTPHSSPPSNETTLTLSQRMRKLSREYGWSAVGVYFALTTLDFPLCYLLVRYLGTDRIGEWEHVIVTSIESLVPQPVKTMWHGWIGSFKRAEQRTAGKVVVTDHVEVGGWGVEEAQDKNRQDASLATQLALAYAIHKSFIFIRVPLTAAITPKVVRVLRGWGWDIGKRTSREVRAINRASKS